MRSYKNLGVLSFAAVGVLSLSLSSPVIFASANVANAISDSAITLSIKNKMLKEPSVSATEISVETKDGVVMLSGNAKSDTEVSTAIELVESTQGVKDIDASNLSITGGTQPLTDSIITAKVKGLFIREKIFGETPISLTGIKVETKEGIVYLSGQVKNKKQAENAIHLARSIAGVKRVSSSIKN